MVPCEDINFLNTIGQRLFSGWMRGARKSILVWELHKENGAGEKGQVHQWSPLVFFKLDFVFLVFMYFCIFKNMLFFVANKENYASALWWSTLLTFAC